MPPFVKSPSSPRTLPIACISSRDSDAPVFHQRPAPSPPKSTGTSAVPVPSSTSCPAGPLLQLSPFLARPSPLADPPRPGASSPVFLVVLALVVAGHPRSSSPEPQLQQPRPAPSSPSTTSSVGLVQPRRPRPLFRQDPPQRRGSPAPRTSPASSLLELGHAPKTHGAPPVRASSRPPRP